MELTADDLVLVTGATGLVGSHVAERMLAAGVPTRVLVRSGNDTSLLEQWGAQIAVGDMTDIESLPAAFKDVTVVVHCAAKVGDWGPIEDYRFVNVQGLRNILDAVKASGTLKRFVHVSSLGVYEARDHHGTDESEPPNTRQVCDVSIRNSKVPFTGLDALESHLG